MYTIENVANQERELQFSSLTRSDLDRLIDVFLNKTRMSNQPISIEIRVYNKSIFYYSNEGATKDQENWIFRKSNTCSHFNMSTLMLKLKMEEKSKTLADYSLSTENYAPYAGSFPLSVRNVGQIGTITVSGMSQLDDHRFVVEGLEEYFSGRD